MVELFVILTPRLVFISVIYRGGNGVSLPPPFSNHSSDAPSSKLSRKDAETRVVHSIIEVTEAQRLRGRQVPGRRTQQAKDFPWAQRGPRIIPD